MSRLKPLAPYALPAAILLLFLVHRILVALTAGDLVYPIEPSEAKNTQIAWDLMTGRFGTHGYGCGRIANSGSVHHASYSSTAFVYLVVSKFTGLHAPVDPTRPASVWAGALAIWLSLITRLMGTTAATYTGIALFLVPTLFLGFSWRLGCHSGPYFPLRPPSRPGLVGHRRQLGPSALGRTRTLCRLPPFSATCCGPSWG